MSESMFIQAVSLARSGRKAEARYLLEQLLKADRTNEMAWLWYAECVDTPAERASALEACMRINPQAQRARLSLSALRQTGTLANDLGLTLPVCVGDEQEERPAKANRNLSAADKWVLSPESNIFTISPDAISPEEFNRVEERTEAFLLKNPDIKPVWKMKANEAVVEAWRPALMVEQPIPAYVEEPEEEEEAVGPDPEKSRGAIFTLLLLTLMFAVLVSAAIMLQAAV